jgi:DNA-binding MarR family transcriptional regulator
MTRHRDESLAAPHIRGRAKAVIGSTPVKRSAARSAKEVQAPDLASRDNGRDHEGYLIKELQHRLRTQIEARIRAKGLWLSFPHSVVLMTLREEPGLSGAQLARRNSVTAQTMNGLLMPLESKGLIERRADPENARILQCYLKPKGVEVLEQGMHEAKGVFGLMLGKLSERERSEFRRILQRCIDALQGGERAADSVSLVPAAKRKVRQLAA